jgi:hypothetical protein
MFYTTKLDTNITFDELNELTDYDRITEGRFGSNVVRIRNGNQVPIVRTTTRYEKPSRIFHEKHLRLVSSIKRHFYYLDIDFNNAMIERYTHEYKSMGFHSDQSIDLADDSYIAIYSCYNDPDTKHTRTLVIKNKEFESNIQKINMEHDSVILFSTKTNSSYLHKIVLDHNNNDYNDYNDIEWIGITFRLSKTFITFNDNVPYFENGEILEMCVHTKEFYKYRSMENKLTNFTYPPLYYTISPSDLLFPI